MDSSVYSRNAIIQWINDILETHYTSFPEVPAKDMGLILFGVFSCPSSPYYGKGKVSLQEIQFTESVTPNVILRNAQHVLSIIKKLCEEETLEEENVNTPSVPAVDTSLNATDWLEGKAFVQELKMWCWIRKKAETWNCTVSEIASTIRDFTGGSLKRTRENAEENTTESVRPKIKLEEGKTVQLLNTYQEERELEKTAARSIHRVIQETQQTIASAPTCSRTATQEVDKENANYTEGTCGKESATDLCSTVIAAALKSNLNTINNLEEKRKKALEACKRKDLVALFSAFQDII